MAKIHKHTQKPFNYRLLTLIIACLFGIIFSIPSFFQDGVKYPLFKDKPKITLGLDLQGGLSLLLDVNVQVAIKNHFSKILSEIKYKTDKQNIFINKLKAQESSVSFTLIDTDKETEINKILANINGSQVKKNGNKFIITLSEEEERNVAKGAIDQAIFIIRKRLDTFGLTEPNVVREGLNQIRVEMPGTNTKEEQDRVIKLISQNAKLDFMAVDETLAIRSDLTESEAMNAGDILLPYATNENAKLPLKSIPILDGSSIVDARPTLEESKNAVSFKLDSKGAEIFGDFTGKNIKKRLAIVLDGKIVSAPSINGRIGGGSGIITGDFTHETAKDLSITLRSGALLAPVSIIEKRSVGPSLGADSIYASFVALIGALVLVAGFMIFYYSVAGIFASLVLIINLFLIIAVMALFHATLTLPGMAGIVLTIGMAVDANIIINERVREALKQGMGVVKALQIGYQNASRAIFDANITSLIASLLLYIYGTGVIKGFAITTGIGILASIITAIIGTHGIYLWLGEKIEKSKKINLWFGIKLDPNLVSLATKDNRIKKKSR
ncbi:protein translocase subunit SecD [Helicobacter didelphidarum]|uniref:Protein translocase subunit SecD n=1 Tax=Helicobacter didelphidarum TaxID=2040648 RepID=A0A3D8IQT6_9HELI|nr:protein translocase subunit SecD [Helicobacter didelphidarum]RDU67648.1 protein translocase subunit SecD [Helicobacter didelphidarum]